MTHTEPAGPKYGNVSSELNLYKMQSCFYLYLALSCLSYRWNEERIGARLVLG